MSFESAMRGHNIVLVVGAGVSLGATSHSRVAGWHGLIEHGIETVVSLSGEPRLQEWKRVCEDLLALGDTDTLMSAASQVQKKLRTLGTQAYANWLRDSIGSLQCEDPSVIDAVQATRFPILTTNYDTLIEGSEGSRCTWLDASEMQAILAGESRAVGHIHGVWSSPESVVLSPEDYSRHLQSSAIQDLQRAVLSVKTLVYVGFGDGFQDPNFTQWLEWHRTVFSESKREHYRLCIDPEIDALRRYHANDSITPVTVGASYEQLASFLRVASPERSALEVTSVGKVRDSIAEAKTRFSEMMRASSVVTFPSLDGLESEVPIVPPPILPVPYAEYIRRRSHEGRTLPSAKRIDPLDVSLNPGVTLIAAEEGGGLSTTLRWMALNAAERLPGTTPLYLPFSQCAGPTKPVTRAARRALRSQALLSDANDSTIPPLVLAVDNVHAYNPTAKTALQEMARLNLGPIFIGCRIGVEDEILTVLQAAGAQPTVRYVGRFESQDVQRFIKLVAPDREATLLDQVIDAFTRTSLPRTPITVATMIYILLHSDSAIATSASQAGILEQYVEVLLGRGNPLEDARFTIEAGGRFSVLASLSELFVSRNSGVISEQDVVSQFARHFERVGWKESPTRLLDNFIKRGVLRRSPDGIEFQHGSFLFLFAAKRAITHADFLDKLLERPLYYSRILAVHAGLSRSDDRTLQALLTGFQQRLKEIGTDPGKAYHSIVQIEAPEIDAAEVTDPRASSGSMSRPEESDSFDELTPLDYPEPIVPLFSDDVDLPVAAEMARILDLFSVVLRDTDQIENLKLKRAALEVVLAAWGSFISVFSRSVPFRDLVDLLAEELEDGELESDDDRDQIAELLERILPVAAAMAGVDATLKSRTLLLLLGSVGETATSTEVELVVGAALLLVAIRERGWPKELSQLHSLAPRMAIWTDFFLVDLERAYLVGSLDDDDRRDALELIVAIRATQFKFSSSRQENFFQDEVRRVLRAKRIKELSRERTASTEDVAQHEDGS